MIDAQRRYFFRGLEPASWFSPELKSLPAHRPCVNCPKKAEASGGPGGPKKADT